MLFFQPHIDYIITNDHPLPVSCSWFSDNMENSRTIILEPSSVIIKLEHISNVVLLTTKQSQMYNQPPSLVIRPIEAHAIQ